MAQRFRPWLLPAMIAFLFLFFFVWPGMYRYEYDPTSLGGRVDRLNGTIQQHTGTTKGWEPITLSEPPRGSGLKRAIREQRLREQGN